MYMRHSTSKTRNIGICSYRMLKSWINKYQYYFIFLSSFNMKEIFADKSWVHQSPALQGNIRGSREDHLHADWELGGRGEPEQWSGQCACPELFKFNRIHFWIRTQEIFYWPKDGPPEHRRLQWSKREGSVFIWSWKMKSQCV